MKERVIRYRSESDDFARNGIKHKDLPADYRFLVRNPIGRAIGTIFYYLTLPFAFLFEKIVYREKIVGRKKLKPYRKTGYFLYGNHTNPVADAFIPTMVTKPKGAYVIVHPANVSIPVLGRINPSLGAIPLPDTKEALKPFTRAIEKAIRKRACVAIYPEAHIWPYCTWIRNFREASFRYPVKYDKPVFCFTDTYQKGRGKNPRMVTYVEGPFFADKSLPVKEQKKDLRDRVYSAMCENAKKNTVELVRYIKRESTQN